MASKRRCLVLTLEAAGNWPPEIALIRALAERGHAVRVVSNANHAESIGAVGAVYEPYQYAPQRDPTIPPEDRTEPEAVRVLRNVFFNPVYADELLAALGRDRPDVLLVDQMLMMASAVAESSGLPTATLWHTVYGATAASPRRVDASFLDQLNALRTKLSLPLLADRWAAVERADAILAFTYEQFDILLPEAPRQLHYVGPLACLPQPLPSYSFPWPPDDIRPLILVSYSTSFQDQVNTLQQVANAVADLEARVLMTLGPAIAASELQLPGNVVAQRFVPHAAVLPHTRLVVTHAGHGTVMAAVTAGVPMVCTPMGRDQYAVSACVERRGLGHVASMTASADELRRAIATALDDEALRQRARTFAAGIDLEAGRRRAIAVLEHL